MKFGLIAALVLFAGVLGGCLPAPSTPLVPTLTPTPTLEPTTTPVWFPATPTFTPPPLPSPRPTEQLRPGVGQRVLVDSFSGSGWQTGDLQGGLAAFGKSALTLSTSGSRNAVLSLREGELPGDAYLEMTVTPSLCRDADAYGLLLRAASAYTFYRFLINCDGQVRLEKVLPERTTVLQDWTPAGAALPGGLLPVRVGVWMAGPELRLFVDGEFVFSARDRVLQDGQLGVYVRAASSSTLTVSFSNLEVYAIDLAQVPTPTSTPTATIEP